MRTALVEMTRHEGARIAIVTEEPICECQDVLVSTSRFSLYGRSYPLADVKNVRIGSPMPQWRLAAACAGISAVLAVSSLLLINIGYATVAFAFAVLALVLRPAKARQLHIEVGAEQLTIWSSNPRVIAEIADAINVAKSSVHAAEREPAVEPSRATARAARASGAA